MSSYKKLDKNLCAIALIIIFFSFIILLSVPLWDIDFWWHLASGQQIFENKSLFKNDPFCFTAEQEISPSQQFLLNGYWLSQVWFYITFALFGYYGLIGLRVMIFLLILLVIFIHCQQRQLHPALTLLVLTLGGWLSLYFTGERPQLFTFLFFVLLLWLFEYIGYARKLPDKGVNTYNTKLALLVPLLMLVWANMHPGFFMGTVLLILFTGTEAVKAFILKYPAEREKFFKLAVIMLLGIFGTLINPNGYKPYLSVWQIEGSVIQQKVSEFTSPLTLMLAGEGLVYPYLICLILSLFVLVRLFKKIELTPLVLAGFLLLLSLRSYRYIPFFVFGGSLLLSKYLSDYVVEQNIRKRLADWIAAVMVLGLLVFAVRGFDAALGLALKSPVNEKRFPTRATPFILQHKPAGKVFNHFNWGGYLDWRLFPEYKVFIDSRALNLRAFHDYTRILWNRNEMKPLLHSYQIKMIIIPALNPFTGELYEMAHYLYEDKDWYLVYRDGVAMVLLRSDENNKDIIAGFSLPKTEIYTQAIGEARGLLQAGLNNYHVWAALHKAYLVKGMAKEAADAGRMAAKLKK